MTLRILPWALFAAVVALLAFRAGTPGPGGAPPAGTRGTDESALEIRLWPVEMREIRDDGGSNRLLAREAVYQYARKSLQGSDVEVFLGGGVRDGSVIRAPRASWDFEGKEILLPDGGRAERGGEWIGELSAAALDLEGRILRVPGAVSLTGPGLSLAGRNLVWNWTDGRITMDSPASRIAPASLPKRKG
jgi:hypothetical protein